METKNMERKFQYGSVQLPDPGIHLSITEVKDLYSASFPELANAEISDPEIVGETMTYTFTRSVGTKG